MIKLKFVGRRKWRELPLYLRENYWWAYLWRPAVWFFDHHPIINAILFGQYSKLMELTLKMVRQPAKGFLQLTCVYGRLSPYIENMVTANEFHLTDVAPSQIYATQKKIHSANVTQMNAEYLGYKDNCFEQLLIFFLLHELPYEARCNTLSEAVRVLKPNGNLLITEYHLQPKHFLIRNPLTRWLLCYWEPFLNDFWHYDLTDHLQRLANEHHKTVVKNQEELVFNGFYRVTRYTIVDNT